KFDVTLRDCAAMGEDFVEMFEQRKANCSGNFWKFTVDPPTFLWNPHVRAPKLSANRRALAHLSRDQMAAPSPIANGFAACSEKLRKSFPRARRGSKRPSRKRRTLRSDDRHLVRHRRPQHPARLPYSN